MHDYNVGDRVRVRTDPVRATRRTIWHEGIVIGSQRKMLGTRYEVRLETGADRGSVLTVDRRNLQPTA